MSNVCKHGSLARSCPICEVEGNLSNMRERAEQAEREVDRLRELVRGQDDGGHWYSQETMNAVAKQRDTVTRMIANAPTGTVTECDLTTDYPTWHVEDHRIGVTLELIGKRVAIVTLTD